MREWRERLMDILEAIERIEKYTIHGRDAFERDELIQIWIVHHLQIIGEAARALPDNLRDKYQDIPWSKIIGMRNILIHNYFGIDVDVVWAVIVNELPALKEKTIAILQEE